MNKGAIQKFAIWARNELIAQVSQRAYQYGIDESGFGDASADTLNGRLLTAEEKSQRQELIKQIKEKGYQQVMEEVAYTWFNRFIALRFMEVNNYLPSHIRVFSDASGAFKPEILNDVLHLDLPGLDSGKVAEYIESNDTEALYRYLLLTQCNALNSALPVMFERMGGYTEMLLPNNILRQDSVLGHMVSDIPEGDWQDAVQIIGWLYQYYNTELKDDTFAQLKKNVKITKERIPAATQLFTPDWIVRYMVENSLGRLWLEGHPNAELRDGWKYYLDEAEQEPEVEAQLAKLREEYKTIKPEEIKVIDPCMGSGHILVYAFDVLMQIYTSAGWDQREAAQSILKNNLYGLDIDDRAAQLAYFAVMMKARQYDRRLLSRGIQPNIYSIRESNGIQAMTIEYFHKNDPKLKTDIESIVTEMRDAKEYGSILNITPVDFAGLYARFDEIREDINMMQMSALDELLPLVKCAEVLAQKYDVVVTNPPYMGNMPVKMTEFVKKEYPVSKYDLYSVFIEKAIKFSKKTGYIALITQHTWMFISSFEELRKKMLYSTINAILHLGTRAFEAIGGEVVQTAAFIIQKAHIAQYKLVAARLVDYQSAADKEQAFLQKRDMYISNADNFKLLPGTPIVYWLSANYFSAVSQGEKIEKYVERKAGVVTGNDSYFVRLWFEVQVADISFNSQPNCTYSKYHAMSKGGSHRRYYGNLEYVIRLKDLWDDSKTNISVRRGDREYYFRTAIGWSQVGNSQKSFRYTSHTVCGTATPTIYVKNEGWYSYILAFLNTKIAYEYLSAFNPTINLLTTDICNIPLLESAMWKAKVKNLCLENVKGSQKDWDSYETSWDFKRNPLV